MTEIINGELVRTDVTKAAMGGTELMAAKMIEYIPKEILSKYHIIHSRVRNLDSTKPKILVLHDLPGDPESDHLRQGGYNHFEKLVFVSNWQMQKYIEYYGIPWYKCTVIKNAIEPIEVVKKTTDKIKIIYHTTPHRGLEILVPVFEHLSILFPMIELNVYSSFKIYGWEERDKHYAELFEKCRTTPNINYHGTVSNDEVRKALAESHIFAYPSIWQETSCISLIEAMSAGCLCVHPNYGALPETASLWTNMYQYVSNPRDHANLFSNKLYNAIVTYSNQENRLYNQKQFIDMFYNWDLRAIEWQILFNELER